jgi:hypothetical protein
MFHTGVVISTFAAVTMLCLSGSPVFRSGNDALCGFVDCEMIDSSIERNGLTLASENSRKLLNTTLVW